MLDAKRSQAGPTLDPIPVLAAKWEKNCARHDSDGRSDHWKFSAKGQVDGSYAPDRGGSTRRQK